MTITDAPETKPDTVAASTQSPTSPRASVAPATSIKLAAKIAWREVARRRARTALVVLLIAVPSAGMVLASVGYRTDQATNNSLDDRPGADIVADRYTTAVIDGDDGGPPPPIAASDLPDGSVVESHLFMGVEIVPAEAPSADSESVYGTLTDMSLDSDLTRDLVDISSGRAPGAGEVLLSPEIADTLELSVGDAMVLARPSGTWTVSGIGRFAPSYWDRLILFGEFDANRIRDEAISYETLIDLPPGTSDADAARIASQVGGYQPGVGSPYFYYEDSNSGDVALGWLIGAMAFLAFGIVIAAAFATSARKQLVTVGHLAANGAPASLINRVLSWQGLWSGLLGGVLGAALALGSLPLLHGPAQVHVFYRTTGWVIRPTDILIVIATATVAGLVAALVPSRSLARTSVLSALAGRRPVKSVPSWLLPVGGLLAAGGTGLMALAVIAGRNSSDSTTFAFVAILGGAGVALGVVCASPWIVQQFARLARWMPLSGRLSLRSLSRSRGRTAAVISAIAVTVALATVVVSGVERETQSTLAGDRYLPLDTVVVSSYTDRLAEAIGTYDYYGELYGAADQVATDQPAAQTGEPLETQVTIEPLPDFELTDAARVALDDLLPGSTLTPLQSAVLPGGEVTVVEGFWPDQRIPIASPATFRAGGWSASAQRQFAEVGFASLVRSGQTAGYVAYQDDDQYLDGGQAPLVALGSPTIIEDASAPEFTSFSQLIGQQYATDAGLDIVTTGFIVTTPESLTADQRNGLSRLWEVLNPGAAPGTYSSFIEPGDPVDMAAQPVAGTEQFTFVQSEYQWVDDNAERALWLSRLIALGAAVVLIGVVVAIGLALAAADNRDERAVLAVVGAQPASLRRMAASNAVTMTLIGIIVGVPAGFLPAWVVVRSASISNIGLPFPWLFVGALLVIVPSVMMLTAWAGSAIAGRFSKPNLHQTA